VPVVGPWREFGFGGGQQVGAVFQCHLRFFQPHLCFFAPWQPVVQLHAGLVATFRQLLALTAGGGQFALYPYLVLLAMALLFFQPGQCGIGFKQALLGLVHGVAGGVVAFAHGFQFGVQMGERRFHGGFFGFDA
jgi:hypothetical protein